MTGAQVPGRRVDVPPEIRDGAARLKAASDRYAGAMGRHWVSDDKAAETCGILIRIAREALILHAEHVAFLADEKII
jgi:hypothetical protein